VFVQKGKVEDAEGGSEETKITGRPRREVDLKKKQGEEDSRQENNGGPKREALYRTCEDWGTQKPRG